MSKWQRIRGKVVEVCCVALLAHGIGSLAGEDGVDTPAVWRLAGIILGVAVLFILLDKGPRDGNEEGN